MIDYEKWHYTCAAELYGASGYSIGGTDARHYVLSGSCTEYAIPGDCHKDVNSHCVYDGPLFFDNAKAEYDPKTKHARFQAPLINRPKCLTLNSGKPCPTGCLARFNTDYIDEEYLCASDPWVSPGVECKLLLPDIGGC